MEFMEQPLNSLGVRPDKAFANDRLDLRIARIIYVSSKRLYTNFDCSKSMRVDDPWKNNFVM